MKTRQIVRRSHFSVEHAGRKAYVSRSVDSADSWHVSLVYNDKGFCAKETLRPALSFGEAYERAREAILFGVVFIEGGRYRYFRT